jgi:hypothetical protein
MSELSKHQARRRTVAVRSARALLIPSLLASALSASSGAEAQSWAAPRNSPALWQVVDIDRTGEPGWPYGAEDVANDGVGRLQADEAGSDVRSVYATADADRLWLRAYVVSASAPPSGVRAFFFLDLDARDNTGGPAHGAELDALLDTDLSFRGYERAIGVDASGDVLGAWEWDASGAAWIEIRNRVAQTVSAEVGSTLDPLRIAGDNHGYLQVSVAHELSTLNASCGGALFVRLVHEGTATRRFGDDALDEFVCEAPRDAYGDPVVLRRAACDSDDDCPANGVCRAGICLFAYECSGAADCLPDHACTGNRCVRVVTGSCTDAGDCDGLVCASGACVSCSSSGARACASGLQCSPNGSCVDPDDIEPGAQPGGPGGSDAGVDGKVQGGALTCSAQASGPAAWSGLGSLLMLGLVLARRRVRREIATTSERAEV